MLSKTHDLYKMSLRCVCKDPHLLAQIRSDQHHKFTFCAATKNAQVKQSELSICDIRSNFMVVLQMEDFKAGVPIMLHLDCVYVFGF